MKSIIVYEETTTGYSAYVPDLPGCIAAGATRAETEQLIREAIGLHVAALQDDREPVPGRERGHRWLASLEKRRSDDDPGKGLGAGDRVGLCGWVHRDN
ncbi:MAG: type II toxin-antitoxin system HicB family antitoxin [Chloroflexi bacterium]|nr:type II toxin-antitoxin system HicB family antitoxin [Chloroflexota bacterium]